MIDLIELLKRIYLFFLMTLLYLKSFLWKFFSLRLKYKLIIFLLALLMFEDFRNFILFNLVRVLSWVL